jgi:RimJ/RimL family protein N-acetyltransferase
MITYMKIIHDTTRLRIRELTIDDAPFILRLLNTPDWLRFIGDRDVHNREQAIRYLENGPFTSYREHGFGLWCVEHLVENLPVGICGLLKRDYLDTPDIGYAFLPEWYYRGFAMESASAVLAMARANWGIEKLAAIVDPENERSIALLNKLGFRFQKELTVQPNNHPTWLFHYEDVE